MKTRLRASLLSVAATMVVMTSWVSSAYASVQKSDYAKRVTIALSSALGDSKTGALAIPVRLSPATIDGFSYADFQQEQGADLAFFDADGNLVPHEIDTWYQEGETLVWVRFPEVSAGATLICCYGGPASGNCAADTWADYSAVYHLGALKGEATYPNSSKLGAVADGTKATVSTAGADGRFGASCYVNAAGTKTGNYQQGGVFVPHSGELSFAGTFTVSGWFKHKNQSYYYDRLFATRSSSGTTGFSVELGNGWTTAGQIQILGASKVVPKLAMSDKMVADWAYCTFVFDGKTYSFYQNGALEWAREATGEVVDSELPFTIGNSSIAKVDGTGSCAWCGWVDEVRVKLGTAQTAEEIAWDYAVQTNDQLLVYGMAMDNQSTAVLMVSANVEGFGAPSPGYGVHMSDEGIAAVAAGDPVLVDGVVHAAQAYTLEYSTDGGLVWTAPERHAGSSFDFAYDGRLTRVTWLWEPVAVAVEVGTSQTSCSLSWSSEPFAIYEGVRYYPVGTTLTVTATDPVAESFREWLDAGAEATVDGNVATIAVGAKPVKMTAVYRYPWVYGDNTLTGGGWTLNATVSGTEVTVTGVAAAPDYGVLDFTSRITAKDGATELTLAAIDNDAFKANATVRKLAVAEGFRKFGWRAFQNCVNLESVEPFFPASLESCGGQAFENCVKLTGDLIISNERCRTLPNKVFAKTSLTSATIAPVTDLSGGSVFEYDVALTNADVSGAVNIGARVFRGCTALERVKLGESLTTLGLEAFVNCSSLVSVTPMLPDSLANFGTSEYNGTLNNGAFSGCTRLALDVRLANAAATNVYGQTFQNCGLTSLYAPHAQKVWKFALNGVPNLTNLTFGAASVDMNSYAPIHNPSGSLEVRFPGAAPILDKELDYRPFGNLNTTRVYCDAKMDSSGWADLMAGSSFLALTDEDRARVDYPGAKTLGCLTESSGLKYWLVRYRSPLRPSAFAFFLR